MIVSMRDCLEHLKLVNSFISEKNACRAVSFPNSTAVMVLSPISCILRLEHSSRMWVNQMHPHVPLMILLILANLQEHRFIRTWISTLTQLKLFYLPMLFTRIIRCRYNVQYIAEYDMWNSDPLVFTLTFYGVFLTSHTINKYNIRCN